MITYLILWYKTAKSSKNMKMYKFISIVLAVTTSIFIYLLAAESCSALPVTNKDEQCLSMHVISNIAAGYINEADELAGFHVDFLTALEKRTGICMDKKLLPYARAQLGIKFGEHDGGLIVSSENIDADVIYIEKIVSSNTVIIPKKGLNLDSYEDLLKIKIGKIRGATLNKRLNNDKNILFVAIKNYSQGLQLLKKGRIDAIAGNGLGLSRIGKGNMFDDVNLAGKLNVGQRDIWLVLSRKSQHLDKIQALRIGAQDLINEGVVDKFLQKYFDIDWKLAN